MQPYTLFLIANLLLQLGALLCYVALIVQMFSHGESGWAIACLVLFLCGCGQLIALVYGWTKVGEWEIGLLMWASTACVLAAIVQVLIMFAALGPSLGS